MDRVRRSTQVRTGGGNTAGFSVEDRTGYLAINGGNKDTSKRKFVAPVDLTDADNVFCIRKRVTLAEANAGIDIVPAKPSARYRLVDAILIAVGGTTAGGTTLDITGVQATSTVKLVAQPLASLARSVPSRIDVIGEVLADGASFAVCDANTPLRLAATGTFTGATHFDVILSYAVESA